MHFFIMTGDTQCHGSEHVIETSNENHICIVIHREYHTANTNRSRKFLKHLDNYFLVQILREQTRKGALLDLLLVNREGVVGEVVIRPSW